MNDEEPLEYNYGGVGAPLPTPAYSNISAQYLTLNLTKVIKSSMTNELVASGVYFNEPQQFANKSAVTATGTAWDTAGYEGGINWQGNSIWQGGTASKKGNTQLPRMYTYESTPPIPWYSLSNIPTDTGWFLKKFSWNVAIKLNGDVWLGSGDYTMQPTVTCDPRRGLKKNQYVNGACFGLPALGSQGQWTLPDAHGPAYFKSDLSVFKDFKISDRQNMQFRISGFNFLNHPISSFASSNLSNLILNTGYADNTVYTNPTDALNNLGIKNKDKFGYTIYKVGQRVAELGFKYNF